MRGEFDPGAVSAGGYFFIGDLYQPIGMREYSRYLGEIAGVWLDAYRPETGGFGFDATDGGQEIITGTRAPAMTVRPYRRGRGFGESREAQCQHVLPEFQRAQI